MLKTKLPLKMIPREQKLQHTKKKFSKQYKKLEPKKRVSLPVQEVSFYYTCTSHTGSKYYILSSCRFR